MSADPAPSRPLISTIYLGAGAIGLVVAAVGYFRTDHVDAILIGASLGAIALAEVIFYLARISGSIDQIAEEAAVIRAKRKELEAAAKLATDAEKFRAEVRAEAEKLRG